MTSGEWDYVIPQFWFQIMKNILTYVCANFDSIWRNINDFMDVNLPLPPLTASLQAKNPGTLVLNYGHFEGNSCELRILSQSIWDLDILKIIKKQVWLFHSNWEQIWKIQRWSHGLYFVNCLQNLCYTVLFHWWLES